jgi:MFS transporter, SP family, sugar:H+ symporter
VITSIINIGTTFVAIASVDRFGRKPLLLIGAAGMAVSLAALAVIFGTAPNAGNGDPDLGSLAGVAALVSANLFVVFFGMSWGPVVWVLLGEMFPNRIRAIALSVAAAAQWVANFAVSNDLPAAQGRGPRPRVRHLRRGRGACRAVRTQGRSGDARQAARGDVALRVRRP